jgi:hypothetical protein
MAARSPQLHILSSPTFQAPNFIDSAGKLHTRHANDIPILRWPDGSWCHPANRFMWELYERGLSRRNRGGSLAVAAAHLSPLLRYCWSERIDPIELNDNNFRELISKLIGERRHNHPGQAARSTEAVIKIGRSCMSFLESVARFHEDEGLIGPKGRIRAMRRAFEIPPSRRRNGGAKTQIYWHHDALPQSSTKKKRLPIASANVEKLKQVVAKVSKTPHQRIRRYVMLKLLEITGARRGEVALLTVASVVNASRMEVPMLYTPTLKKGGEHLEYRYIPISRADAKFLAQYAEIHRRILVGRVLKGKDHGLFLVSGTTGEALKPNSITAEVRRLAASAGISQKACPHMFRHRFITKLFVAMIEQHQIENPDHFRRMLIDEEQFKRKVAEFTGTGISSLDHYIDLAFEEVGNFQRVYDLTTVGLTVDSFIGTLDAMIAQASSGEVPYLSAQRLLELMQALRLDLEAAKSKVSDSAQSDPRDISSARSA